ITSPSEHPQHGYPIITLADFNSNDEVILVENSASGGEISNLVIRGPNDNNVLCAGNPLDCMDEKVGIRLQASDFLIHNCRLIQCMTGVYLESPEGTGGTGNTISNCLLGDRWINPLDKTITEEYWTTVHEGAPILHPGNGFGVVVVEPSWDNSAGHIYTNRAANEIVDCMIRSNRYYGVVLTNGARTHIAHNVIAWNGDHNAGFSPYVPGRSGGVLSYFSEPQIQSNDNKMQAPTLFSNNIYGNIGYQVGIFTESSSYLHIYNTPVLWGNNIGVDTDTPFAEALKYDYLICCGPYPSAIPTSTPAPGTPTSTPAPGQIPIPGYEYHGSGPIIAWNNLHDGTGAGRFAYHPIQWNCLPTSTPATPSTNTPIPTWTPSGDTPTPTPAAFPSEPMPTGIPWSPTPTPATPTPYFTPTPDYYKINDHGWRFGGIKKNPEFNGWIVHPDESPEFDWHLIDFYILQNTPVATNTPSMCFDMGGLSLNPGSSTLEMFQDAGFVDMGRHVRGQVPPVEMFSAYQEEGIYYLDWTIPAYRSDGSIFQTSDIGGYVVLTGIAKENDESSLDHGAEGTIQIVGEPIYVTADMSTYTVYIVPADITHFGIYIYDIQGMESEIVWKRIDTYGT
nr:NosD domain-containing protein [bacterium]